MKLAEHEQVEKATDDGGEKAKMHVDDVYYEADHAWENTFAHDWANVEEKGGVASLVKVTLSSGMSKRLGIESGGGTRASEEWLWVQDQLELLQQAWSSRSGRRYAHMHQAFELFSAWEGAAGGLSLMQWMKWMRQLGLVARAREIRETAEEDSNRAVAKGADAAGYVTNMEVEEHRVPTEEHLREVFVSATGLPKFTEKEELAAENNRSATEVEEGTDGEDGEDGEGGEENDTGDEDKQDPETYKRFQRQMHADLCSQGVVLMQRHEALEAFTHLAMMWAIPVAPKVVEQTTAAPVPASLDTANEGEAEQVQGTKQSKENVATDDTAAVPTTLVSAPSKMPAASLRLSSKASPRSSPRASPRSVPGSPRSPRSRGMAMAQRVSMLLLRSLTKQHDEELKYDMLLQHNHMQCFVDGSEDGIGIALMVATFVDRLLVPSIATTSKTEAAALIAAMSAGAAMQAVMSAGAAMQAIINAEESAESGAAARAAAAVFLPADVPATTCDTSTTAADKVTTSLGGSLESTDGQMNSRARRRSCSRARSSSFSLAAAMENAGSASMFRLPFVCADFVPNEWRRDRLYTETLDLLLHQNHSVLLAVFKRYATLASLSNQPQAEGGGNGTNGSRPPSRASAREGVSPAPSSSSSHEGASAKHSHRHDCGEDGTSDGVWGLSLEAFISFLADCDFCCSPLTFPNGNAGVGSHKAHGGVSGGLITDYHARLCFHWAKHHHQHSTHHSRGRLHFSSAAPSEQHQPRQRQHHLHPRLARGPVGGVARESPAVLYFSEFVEALALVAEVMPLPALVHLHTACCRDVIKYFTGLSSPNAQWQSTPTTSTPTTPIAEASVLGSPARTTSRALAVKSPRQSPRQSPRPPSRARAVSHEKKAHRSNDRTKSKDNHPPLPHPISVTRPLFHAVTSIAANMQTTTPELCTVLLMKPLLARQFDRPLHQRVALLLTMVYWRLELRLMAKKGKKAVQLAKELATQKVTMVASAHIGVICTNRANARRRMAMLRADATPPPS
jgi:hypothetical protein